MGKLCFTKRSLQFSEFAHKSLGNSIPPSPMFFFSLVLPFSPPAAASSGFHPYPHPFSLSPSAQLQAAVRHDELGGDAVQPGTASSPIHAKVEAGATQRRFDAQRMTGGGGRPALIASQQVGRTTELQNPEVRAESNRRVREG
jgi:hypothetical protein